MPITLDTTRRERLGLFVGAPTRGVIRYARGRITVLDRPKLEQLCCECYGVVKKETDRLLPRNSRSNTDRSPIVSCTDAGNPSVR
jgi:hypothetical protein